MMSEKDIERWKAQLEYADRMWYEAGLIEKGEHGVGQRPNHTVGVNAYIDDYRGLQAAPFSGAELTDGDRFIGNLTFAITNTIISMLSSRDPEVQVKAKGGTLAKFDATRRARLNQRILQSSIREGKYKREVDRMLQCALTTSFGLVRHGYTPDVEEYTDGEEVFQRFKNETPDYPWIRFYRPWDVRIDPLVNNFDPDTEPRWVAFRDLYTENEIKKNKNIINRKGWQPTFNPQIMKREDDKIRIESSPDITKLYEVWTFYDASKREWFAISPGTDKEVRKREEWPIEWGQLPYTILTFNEQVDTPIGIPFPRVYANEQAMYNRVWTIINSIISRTRRVVAVNGQAFDSKDAQKENIFNMQSLMEFIECDGNPNDVLKEINVGFIDPQLIGLLYQLKESVREVIGVSNFDRGQRANVETAAEANQIGAGANVQKSRIQTKVEDAWTEIVRVSHRAMQQVEDDRKFVIPIVGEENQTFLSNEEANAGFAVASLQDLAGDFDYYVKQNSTLPLDAEARYAKAASAYQVLGGVQGSMLDQRAVARDIVTYADQDEHRWVPEQQVINEQAKLEQQQTEDPAGGEAQVSQGGINPIAALVGSGQQ